MQFEPVPFLPNVERPSKADLFRSAGGFVDVAAEEVFRLVPPDKIADGLAAEVATLAGAVEIGSKWRTMADHHERRQAGKRREAFGQFRLRVFTGCIERRRIRVAKPGDGVSIDAHRLA